MCLSGVYENCCPTEARSKSQEQRELSALIGDRPFAHDGVGDGQGHRLQIIDIHLSHDVAVNGTGGVLEAAGTAGDRVSHAGSAPRSLNMNEELITVGCGECLLARNHVRGWIVAPEPHAGETAELRMVASDATATACTTKRVLFTSEEPRGRIFNGMLLNAATKEV